MGSRESWARRHPWADRVASVAVVLAGGTFILWLGVDTLANVAESRRMEAEADSSLEAVSRHSGLVIPDKAVVDSACRSVRTKRDPWYRLRVTPGDAATFMDQPALRDGWKPGNAAAHEGQYSAARYWRELDDAKDCRSFDGKGPAQGTHIVVTVCADDPGVSTVYLCVWSHAPATKR